MMKSLQLLITFLAGAQCNTASPPVPRRVLGGKTTKAGKVAKTQRRSPTSSPAPSMSSGPITSSKQECTVIDGKSQDCAVDFFCSIKMGCADVSGFCREKGLICTEQYDPVCGCDGVTYGNSCRASSIGSNIAFKGECPSSSPPPTVVKTPGEMKEECDRLRPCHEDLICYPPPADLSHTIGVCGCDDDTDCNNSVDGAICVETDYLNGPYQHKAKFCALCHPLTHAGCDPLSGTPFCSQGNGYVECTCGSDSDCPDNMKCGAPSCVADILNYCSEDHDAEWCTFELKNSSP